MEKRTNSEKEWLEGLLTFVSLAEAERKFIAAELHDEILHTLGRLSRRASELARAPEKSDCGHLQELATELNKVVDDVREVMENLSPSLLDNVGLLSALESYLRGAAHTGSFQPHIAISLDEQELELNEAEQLALFRIVQEAINNIVKHAQADHVYLNAFGDCTELVLQVTDNGRGLDAARQIGLARGMGNMRFRARLIGATIEWHANPDGGTLVDIRLKRGTV
jgi:two-component system sensor histidine kinase UhpB